MQPAATEPPSRLARKLSTFDAVLIGLSSMIGAGVFVVFGLAARAAGNGLLIGLLLAAIVAFCNATSSSQLAAIHPSSGGAYVYGRERLNATFGFLAGWSFILGKTSSCAAMALTIGVYLAPDFELPIAIGSVVVLSVVNYLGIESTARTARLLVPLVLLTLAVVIVSGLATAGSHSPIAPVLSNAGTRGFLQAGALIFFAFAGYARIGTLGEEVRQPARAIPRAIVIALSITLVVYALVAVASLEALGADGLASSPFPLAQVAKLGFDWAERAVRMGAAIAAIGALLTLLAGISRTMFAMARNGDLPAWLGAVHARRKVPHHAETAVAGAVVAALSITDLLGAVGLSSFLVLGYYAITNVAALRLGSSERRWPRAMAVTGLAGCVLLALSLPMPALLAGIGLLALGAGARALRSRSI